MDLSHFITCLQLVVLTIILNAFTYSSAKPTYLSFDNYMAPIRPIERFGNDYYYGAYAAEPLTAHRLERLRRGYYYVDGGYITAVSASQVPTTSSSSSSSNRRQDVIADAGATGDNGGVRYNPILKYKQTRTKRKKLFVPNLFG